MPSSTPECEAGPHLLPLTVPLSRLRRWRADHLRLDFRNQQHRLVRPVIAQLTPGDGRCDERIAGPERELGVGADFSGSCAPGVAIAAARVTTTRAVKRTVSVPDSR